ncbi:heme ABC transporter ATP-binding protein [Spirochaetia bacterium]|nr:heme ABC transporter ATP-binding protein [Spirochaetia bacterium]
MALEVQSVSFSWPRREALKSVSLSLKPGEFVGFLGPNGSGKSTFLKNILGFLKPSSGRVLYSGCGEILEEFSDAKNSRSERSRRLAFVPQSPAFRAAFTVSELVLMGRLPHLKDRWGGYSPADKQKAVNVMEMLGITPLAERNVMTLSGGEIQKAVIARCLAQEADVLLLDEATSGLDLNHAIEIMELMRKKADEENKIILAVLHDINLASQYCDRILFLKDGSLRYQGKPSEILSEKVLEDIYGIRVAIHPDENGRPFVLPRREARNVY